MSNTPTEPVRVGQLVMLLCAALAAAAPTVAAGPPPDVVQAACRAGWLRSDAGLGIAPTQPVVHATVGAPVAIYFKPACAAPFARTARAEVADPRMVRVIDQGDLAAGSELGCAIVEAVSAGRTSVTIAGARVDLEVSADGAGTGGSASRWTGGDQPPRIVAPLDGAAAWGVISVSASWWRGDADGQSEGAPPRLAVEGLAGSPIAPSWASPAADGPMGVAAFDVDTSSLPPGPVILRLVWSAGDSGPSADSSSLSARRAGAAIQLRVFHPGTAETGSTALVSGECEATYDLPELPPERREGKPAIRKNDAASGGAFFDSAGASPHFRFPMSVSEPAGTGWYQVVLTAAGDRACGVWPAVGVAVDEAQYPVTRSAIAKGSFHRVPIGTPIRLEPGSHVLRLDFLNDFYAANGADRNLRLDKIEVLRVADATRATPVASTPDPQSMMAMTGGGGGDAMMSMTAMQPAGRGVGAAGGAGADRTSRWPENAARTRNSGSLMLAFARPLDGVSIAGDMDVRGLLSWSGMGDKNAPPPRTQLLLNGRPIGSQVSAAPRFVVPWELFVPGENRLRLATDEPGVGVAATEATIRRPGPAAATSFDQSVASASADRFIRLTVHDAGWDSASRERIIADQNPPERICFGMFSAGDLVLQLPPEVAGDYEIDVEAKGQQFRGAPELTVSLETEGQLPPCVLGTLAVPGGWDAHPLQKGVPTDKRRTAAIAQLTPGPKSLRLTFDNDLYEADKGDRNVFIQAVTLRAVPPAGLEPSIGGVAILHPAPGETLGAGGGDAVVIDVEGSVAPQTAELLVDGAPTGAPVNLRGRPGPFLLPLTLRDTPAGPHRLEVRLTDARSRVVTSAGREVNVTSSDGRRTRYQRAVHLLNRLAFGPDERELIAILTLGEEKYLDERLADGPDSPRVRAAVDAAAVRYPNSSNAGDVQRRAIFEAINTQNPLRTRFVLWAENHFSTWIRKTESRRKADEHDRFTRLGIAPFRELLLASATSPAMLRYLDQEQSFARRLNENYAREIMELHTLGVHGGYTQQDVTALARILTGWTTAREAFVALDPAPGEAGEDGVGPDEYGMRESFRFDPALNDAAERSFLGRTFEPARPEDRHLKVLSAIAMLASHPSTARFIAGKIAAHYVSFPPPEDLVADLASTFERTGGDMQELLRTLANHPRFWDSPPRLAHPPDFAFRLAREVGSTDAQAVHEYLNLSGRGMFDRSTPDGYQEDDTESMDSNAMLQRWKFARRLESALFELVAPAARSGDKPIDDPEAQRVIDLISTRITGRLLGESSNRAALDLLRGTEGRRDERWRALAVFIASTPEAQLR